MTVPEPGGVALPPSAGPVGELPAASASLGRRGRLAAAIADAVGTVPGVRLTAGSGVAVATQYRGGRVAGVSLGDESVTVQIVAETVPLPPLLEAVHRTAAAALVRAGDSRPVHVHVDDVDLVGRTSGVGR